jgi:methionyl-tRNA formyltransferase
MQLEIIKHPNKILRQRAQEIENFLDPKIQTLIDDMIETMGKVKGVGLAAPQISKSIRLIVVNVKNKPLVIFNPKIIWFSGKKEIDEESCLSIPGVYGLVERSKKIKIEGKDRIGKNIEFKAEGLFARVLQHEVDHLDGVLIIDKFIKK